MPHRRVSAAGPEGKGDVEANASEAPPEQLMISTLARGSSDMPTGGLAKAKARMLVRRLVPRLLPRSLTDGSTTSIGVDPPMLHH